MIKEEARRILMALLIAYDNCEHGDYFYEYGNEVCEAVECMLSKSDMPVVHGRWEWYDHTISFAWIDRGYMCSACGHKQEDETNYCPNCGAKMDLEVDGNG